MNKWLYALLFFMLMSSIALSELNEYYGAWAFYLLGLVMVIVAYLRKGDAGVLLRVEGDWVAPWEALPR